MRICTSESTQGQYREGQLPGIVDFRCESYAVRFRADPGACRLGINSIRQKRQMGEGKTDTLLGELELNALFKEKTPQMTYFQPHWTLRLSAPALADQCKVAVGWRAKFFKKAMSRS